MHVVFASSSITNRKYGDPNLLNCQFYWHEMDVTEGENRNIEFIILAVSDEPISPFPPWNRLLAQRYLDSAAEKSICITDREMITNYNWLWAEWG